MRRLIFIPGKYMLLTRNSFFILLFILIVSPIPLYKLIWIAGSREAVGTMYFTGHGNLGSALGISSYPVIWFVVGKDTIYFNGNVNIPLKEGEKISIRYQRSNPQNAKMNIFTSIWGDTMAYMTGPLLFFLVIYFHPDLVPKKAKVLIGRKKPWIKFI
jgi:hypothetical protein